MCAFTFFKHVLSSVVKSSMPNPIFKAINVNCVFYLRCGKKKKKTGIVKKFVPDLIRRTGDVQYLMTLITINISEGFF